jgi:hypothetical protein
MYWTRIPPTLRRAAATSAALVFVAGTQFCLLGALMGLPMACVALPAAMAKAKLPPCHMAAMAHPAPATPHAPASGHASPIGCGDSSPCCLSAAPVHSPQVERADVTDGVVLTGDGGTATELAADVSRARAPLAESPPPLSDPPAPSLGRAPPLA